MAQTNPVIANDWYVGMTVPPLKIPLNTDSGIDDISALQEHDITVTIRNLNTTVPTDTLGTGPVHILSAKPALISYQFRAADVAVAGSFQLIVKGNFPASPDGLVEAGVAIWDPISITLKSI